MTESEHEWLPARKKPISVHYRKVGTYEIGIATPEGLMTCNPRDNYIIMGIAGEQYPIKKCIFHQTYTTKSSNLSIGHWAFLFTAFGFYGSIGEILIGTIFSIFGRTLWLYYNGFFTSPESFFLFGIFGCIGFKIFLTLRRRYPSLSTSLQ